MRTITRGDLMSAACRQENCTVGETGTCLLNNDPAICPNHILGTIEVNEQTAPPLKEPERNPQFPRSLTLTSIQVEELMAGRYCRLVGILGAPDAGKTAALVSLYLLLSRGQLNGVRFADSQSLLAFDEISHGARRWNDGHMPDQLTVHTELNEGRSAGFLHLRLLPDTGNAVDLLLPDLPGEWTTAMIDSGRVDRWNFLKGADVIWLMVDGRQLLTASTRQLALHRTKLLMQRLAAFVSSTLPIILVVTRRDGGEINQNTLDELSHEAVNQSLNLRILQIASFADAGSIRPGTGIAELIDASIESDSDNPVLWPHTSQNESQSRAMMRFRAGGGHD
jgi:Double-GTPase 2